MLTKRKFFTFCELPLKPYQFVVEVEQRFIADVCCSSPH
jgi:hypothetical protein